jgi:hypothetical protein
MTLTKQLPSHRQSSKAKSSSVMVRQPSPILDDQGLCGATKAYRLIGALA